MSKPNSDVQQPVNRIQQNVLAASERRLINWICPRLPAWVTPDLLTLIGVIGAVIIFAGYALSGFSRDWLWLCIVGYSVQWFGDSLDGSIARFRKIERPKFGYFIDHSCDGLTLLLILGGIGLSPWVRSDVALFTLAGYLLLSIHAFLSTHVTGEFKLSYLAAGPTELRFVLIAMTLLMMALPHNAGMTSGLSGFDMFVGIVGVVFVVLFVIQTLVTAKKLAAIKE
ncbi:CDP-alcohol phosphatidyltransferase family protein [Novosphingobium sp.]|uniref:CDP-alcohol phosphatidyltransferase family protein n=1 Tax=Novosphingobium sp. TaxID=1874826 RepID=UPI0025E0ADE8|nr:CDP-alcohol phosphatidyltransferase family protein [Novosphingobium sp.]